MVCIAVEKYINTIHSSIGKTPKETLFGITNNCTSPEQLEEIRTKRYEEVLVNLQEMQLKSLQKHKRTRIDPPNLETGQNV